MKRIISLLLPLLLILSALPGIAEEVWAPREAPAVRNAMSETEQLAAQNAILERGTLLFSAKVNKGWYPSDLNWLKTAQPDDALALVWACDDVTHGGWGVLGLNVGGKQKDIAAVSDQPDKERLMIFSVQELMDMAGITDPAKFTKFQLGAWNGGRIAGLYFLTADVAAELNAHLAAVEASQAIIHTYNGELSNENAIPAAQVVYDYFQEINGKLYTYGVEF